MRIAVVLLISTAPALGWASDEPWYEQVRHQIAEIGAFHVIWTDDPDAGHTRLTRTEAFQVLLDSREFLDHRVGSAPMPSIQVYAFNIVLQQEDAADAFNHLYRRAQLPGKLYALCGLYYLDYPRFLEYLNQLGHLDVDVVGNRGCVVGVYFPLEDILVRIEDGTLPEGFTRVSELAESWFSRERPPN